MSRLMTSFLNYQASRAFLPLVVRDAVAEPMATPTAAPSGFAMDELHVVEIVERTMSPISILGSIFVLVSFLTCPSLNQKSVNRLIFYASWGNMITNVATLISVSGLRAGTKSGLCQAQGFLIQWFMPADCLWTFCLSVNVFLTFNSMRFNVRLRSLEPIYCVLCYGIPLAPALTYLVLDLGYGKEIYGNATIWCWVTEEHRVLRLAAFYGPVWIVIAATITIYSFVGRNIYKNRVNNSYVQQQLDTDFSDATLSTIGKTELSRRISTFGKSELSRNLGSIVRTHEVSVETRPSSITKELDLSSDSITPQPAHDSLFAALQPHNVDRTSTALLMEESTRPPVPPKDAKYIFRRSQTPSYNNKSQRSSRRTEYTASISGPSSPPVTPPQNLHVRQINTNAMRGAQTYAHVAILLFIVMLVVWVPSTVNRVYSFNHRPNFGLNVAAAAVLPLQGFFNCVIYCFTSRAQLKGIWNRIKMKLLRKQPSVKTEMVGPTSLPKGLMDIGEGSLRDRRSMMQNRLDELDDLDSRYDIDEELRVGDDSPDGPWIAPERPQPVVFPTNGRTYNPPHLEVPERRRSDGG